MKTEQDFTALHLDKQLCFPLYAASRLTTQLYEPFLSELDITYPQYLVLLVLWQHNGLTVTEIGARLYLESNTLTPLLKRLEQKELVLRKRSSEDERKVVVSLTEKGEQLKEKAVLIPEKILSSFSDDAVALEEIAGFHKTLNKLLGQLNTKLTSA
ncbi:MarR family winged helix-turn-helix transcriptional regulator [Emticicia sp. TH156]|uniref:MarR family winged helix-turn-helix transcriptional regulator n=1 Tax=Emticicia sp. TH156 TaxID=2067454 RepID=UPI000C77D522|nr:MarR family transcriptional regulator [Emticicia sp. TH156]PLK44712.1 MarR family transcriptional regulator [Emticicia sp. TH156]